MANTPQDLVNIINEIIIDNNENLVTPHGLRKVLTEMAQSIPQGDASAVSASAPLLFDPFTNTFSLGEIKTSDLENDGEDGINKFISLLDLPNNLVLYPTNAASDVSGYSKMVMDIHDPDFNTTAVDISTGSISGTAQLVASLASSTGVIEGNPGVFNITTIGNITRTAGSGTAEFFFRVYKRNLAGTETLITQSSNTIPVTNTGYSEFSATALWDDGDWLITDRIVIKYYANRIVGGSNPTYNFQFGGSSPVRTLVPIPLSVVPTGFVKSNENLALAKRKGDVLYGILDQYTSEEIILNKTTDSNTVDSVIYFSLGTEKFKRVFTDLKLRWFGAKGDGVTNDAVAFQNAVSVFSNDFTLDLEKGYTYIIGASGVLLQNRKNVKIKGKSTIKYTAVSPYSIESLGKVGIKVDTCTNFEIEDVEFNGNGIVQGVIGFVNCLNEKIRNIEAYSSASIVAQIISAKAVKPSYVGNIIRNSLGTQCRGMWIGNLTPAEFCNDILIRDNKVFGNTASGIICTSDGGEIYGNEVYGNAGSGIVIPSGNSMSAKNLKIFGNKCTRNLFSGIQSDAVYVTDADLTNNISIYGNICSENDSSGIFLVNSNNYSVVGNVCNDNNFDNSGTGAGIQADDRSYNATISNNICTDTRVGAAKTQNFGIKILCQNANGKNILISNNICNENKIDGIYVETASTFEINYLNITNNNCFSNGSRGIFVNEATATKIKASITLNNCFSNTTQDIRATAKDVYIEGNRYSTSLDVFYKNFDALDTTPHVGMRKSWRANNASATSITNFLGAQEGAEMTILFSNGNTTLVQGTLQLKGAVNVVGVSNGSITLRFQAATWREVGRSF